MEMGSPSLGRRARSAPADLFDLLATVSKAQTRSPTSVWWPVTASPSTCR